MEGMVLLLRYTHRSSWSGSGAVSLSRFAVEVRLTHIPRRFDAYHAADKADTREQVVTLLVGRRSVVQKRDGTGMQVLVYSFLTGVI